MLAPKSALDFNSGGKSGWVAVMDKQLVDQAWRAEQNKGRAFEMTYGGALSFLRRRYSRELASVDIAVSGIPFDSATTYRPGCRLGPRAIRAASVQLAELRAFPSGIDPFDWLSVVDYGDCFLNPHDPASIEGAMLTHARTILDSGARMLTLGGDHFISYPLLKAHAERYGPLALLQFDAHGDTWESAGPLDHGTMFRRAIQEGLIDVERSLRVGIRTQDDADFGLLTLSSAWVHRQGIDAALDAIRHRIGQAPCYLTFDIDVLDPAFAPGTGTPVSGGLASWQALELIRGLDALTFVGMDLVEVNPAYDSAEITAIVAATLAHDWIALLAQQKRSA